MLKNIKVCIKIVLLNFLFAVIKICPNLQSLNEYVVLYWGRYIPNSKSDLGDI